MTISIGQICWIIHMIVQHNINTFHWFTGYCVQCNILPWNWYTFFATGFLPTQITIFQQIKNQKLNSIFFLPFSIFVESKPNETSILDTYSSVMYKVPEFICVWFIFISTFSNFFTKPSSGDINGPIKAISKNKINFFFFVCFLKWLIKSELNCTQYSFCRIMPYTESPKFVRENNKSERITRLCQICK